MRGDEAGRRGLDLSVFTPYRVAVLGRAMSERLGEAYSNEDLTIPEWRVLAVVSQADAVAARDVVKRTPMDKMAVSRAVAALEAKGLVQRSPAPDRRMAALRLTPKGAGVFERVSAIALAYEAALLAALSADERRAFLEAISKLEAAIENAAAAAEGDPRAAE